MIKINKVERLITLYGLLDLETCTEFCEALYEWEKFDLDVFSGKKVLMKMIEDEEGFMYESTLPSDEYVSKPITIFINSKESISADVLFAMFDAIEINSLKIEIILTGAVSEGVINLVKDFSFVKCTKRTLFYGGLDAEEALKKGIVKEIITREKFI